MTSEPRSYVLLTSPFFVLFKIGFNVKKIRGASHNNYDVDAACKRGLVFCSKSFSFGRNNEVTSQEGVVNVIGIVERMCHKVITCIVIVKQSFLLKYLLFAVICLLCSPQEPPPPPPPEPAWHETESEVVHLTDENFKSFLKKKKHTIVMYYAPCKYFWFIIQISYPKY